jgi:hypothetical protein
MLLKPDLQSVPLLAMLQHGLKQMGDLVLIVLTVTKINQ